MKFYKDKNCLNKIYSNKLNAVYSYSYYDTLNTMNLIYAIQFIKNGKIYNPKNAATIYSYGYKYFYLFDKCYGSQNTFNKLSWRKFVKTMKLKAFL